MANPNTIKQIVQLFQKLGGNVSEVMGTKTNINFLGKGKSPELMLDMDINTDALGVLSQSKAVDELKNSVGYAVGDKLNCEVILPQHAGVANAIGAVVGKIVMRETGVISSPSEGKFLVHLDGKPVNFTSEAEALKVLEEKLTEKSIQKAKEAGAENVTVNIDREIKTANIENRAVFVEANVLVEASGRPRISIS